MDDKEIVKKIIQRHRDEINAKQYHSIFQTLTSIKAKVLFLRFLLDFCDKNELLELVSDIKTPAGDIALVVQFVLQLLDNTSSESENFIYLESALSESELSEVETDTEAQKAYVSALHLVGIPEIYDVADGKGYWQQGRDYLIGNGTTPLDRWVTLTNLEYFDGDFDCIEMKDFRRLW